MKFEEIELPSNRRFGFFFSIIFVFLGLLLISEDCFFIGYSALGLSGLFVIFSFYWPNFLLPLNKSWMFVGLFLGKIMNPIILGIFFFGLITPLSIFLRLFGRDELHLKRNRAGSEWRNQDGNSDQLRSFKNQY